MKFTRMEVFAAFLGISIGITGPVQANSVLDFGIAAPTPGSISYAGVNAPLVGANIDVDTIIGLGTPANNNVISSCTSCRLDFTTGNFSGVSGNSWVFSSGGTITVTGGVDFLDTLPDPDIPNGSTLLSGVFTEAQVVDLGGDAFEFQIFGAAFTDTKHPDLLAYYGLPNIEYLGGLNISFEVSEPAEPDPSEPNKPFESAKIFSGDITNTPIPVPAAIWLMGTGLVGLVCVAKVRKQQVINTHI